jgi:glycosyltransferase involved in cell wall biosynthesis
MLEITVIIPTYNRAGHVTDAINSVMTQTYQKYEIIVVDDGSTDNTRSSLAPYINKGQIQYIYQTNKGVSAARNAGIKASKGQWIAFLDSDDLWLPDKLSRQVSLINNSKTELGCVICNMQYNPSIGNISNSFQNAPFTPIHPQGICFNISSILLTRFILFNQGAMIRKSHLDEIGGYDEELEILEDYDIALRLSFLCNWGYDTTSLVIYQRGSENSLSFNITSDYETEKIINILKNLEDYLYNMKISLPELLRLQIRYHTFRKNFERFLFAKFVLKLHGFLSRRALKYPKPITEEIKMVS